MARMSMPCQAPLSSVHQHSFKVAMIDVCGRQLVLSVVIVMLAH